MSAKRGALRGRRNGTQGREHQDEARLSFQTRPERRAGPREAHPGRRPSDRSSPRRSLGAPAAPRAPRAESAAESPDPSEKGASSLGSENLTSNTV